eukprot:TRINITY_DN19895_c0_g1_i1.p1 TRINITY_DN19895_c0_g1~~TRINITY_DN19895_c0_g1_i1.p1  ORF type:complete len:227 (-),score=9.53 TRINITY_DN19895_c0_g1_i1:11-691(-)
MSIFYKALPAIYFCVVLASDSGCIALATNGPAIIGYEHDCLVFQDGSVDCDAEHLEAPFFVQVRRGTAPQAAPLKVPRQGPRRQRLARSKRTSSRRLVNVSHIGQAAFAVRGQPDLPDALTLCAKHDKCSQSTGHCCPRPDGKMDDCCDLEKELEIPYSEAPGPVRDYVDSKYKLGKVEDVEWESEHKDANGEPLWNVEVEIWYEQATFELDILPNGTVLEFDLDD